MGREDSAGSTWRKASFSTTGWRAQQTGPQGSAQPLPASPGPLAPLGSGASRERQLGEISRWTSHLLWALGKHISGCFLFPSQAEPTFPPEGEVQAWSPGCPGWGPPAPNSLVGRPSRKSQKCMSGAHRRCKINAQLSSSRRNRGLSTIPRTIPSILFP